MLVVDGDLADLAVELIEDLSLARLVGQRANGQQLQDQDLAALELDVELLSDQGRGQEEARRQHAEVAVLARELLVVLEHLGVHDVAGDIGFGDAAETLVEILAHLGEVDWVEVEAWSLVHLAAAAESVRA